MGPSHDVAEESGLPESTSEEITRLLAATEERGRILAERTALLAKQVEAVNETNQLAQRDVVAREKLVEEVAACKDSINALVTDIHNIIDRQILVMGRQITTNQIQIISDQLAILAQVLGQLVTGIALLGRNNEAADELERLRLDMVALLREAVSQQSDLSVTTIGQVGRDLSGNVAGRNIEEERTNE